MATGNYEKTTSGLRTTIEIHSALYFQADCYDVRRMAINREDRVFGNGWRSFPRRASQHSSVGQSLLPIGRG